MMIRKIATTQMTQTVMIVALCTELRMAFSLCIFIGLTGFVRCLMSEVSMPETVAITFALTMIVFISIIIGAILPLLLYFINLDPAHSATSIQVIMDILGVLLTCSIAYLLLETEGGGHFLRWIDVF